ISCGTGAELLQLGQVAIDRVAAPIEPERLLFKGVLLGLRPGRRLRQRRASRAVAALVDVEGAEQVALPAVPVTLHARAVLPRGVDRDVQPRARRPGRQRVE